MLYTVLDCNKEKAEVTPLKSSLFGKSYGYDALERHMERSGERIEKDNSREHTRHRLAEAFLKAPNLFTLLITKMFLSLQTELIVVYW